MAEAPYNINSGAFLGSIGQFGKKAGSGIEKFGKRLAKPLAKNEAKQKIAANAAAKAAEQAATKAAKEEATADANKKARAAATRRATTAHKVKLSRAAEFESQKTGLLVERAKALAEAKAASKPAAPKSAARKTASGVSTDKDGVLKPAASKNKSAPKSQPVKAGPKLDPKAGETYND
jgi:hypothetical protein